MTLETRTLTRALEFRAGEVWRVSPSCNHYEVSSLGSVRRAFASAKGHPAGVILRPRPLPSGYLRTGGDHYIHRLVCEAFHGPAPSPRHEVAHRDGNRQNNAASNLYWATHIENEADKVRHGTLLRGERVGGSKLKPSDVGKIRELAATSTQRVVAAKFGVTQMVVSKIVRGLMWRHVA